MSDNTPTLNFGPEWLKRIGDGGNSVTSPPPPPTPAASTVSAPSATYRLAANRYDREELLALFTPNATPPDDLLEHGGVIIEKKIQHPLVFKGITESEQRLLSGHWNSSAVLRLMSTGGGTVVGGGGGGGGGGNLTRGGRAIGRGGPADRGRGRGGRGRGGDSGGYYTRVYDDGEGYSSGRGRRNDSWDDDRVRYDRGGFASSQRGGYHVSEVNDPAGGGPDRGNTSPRKDFLRSMSSDNWREKADEKDEGGDWRRAGGSKGDRWGGGGGGPRGGSSWRDHHAAMDRDPAPPRPRVDGGGRYHDNEYRVNRDGGGPPQYTRSYSSGNRNTRNSFNEEDDGKRDLPEWCAADADDIGTFDSSGAFMSVRDMKQEMKEIERRGSRGKSMEDGRYTRKDSPRDQDPERPHSRWRDDNNEEKASLNNDKSREKSPAADRERVKNNGPSKPSTLPRNEEKDSGSKSGGARGEENPQYNSVHRGENVREDARENVRENVREDARENVRENDREKDRVNKSSSSSSISSLSNNKSSQSSTTAPTTTATSSSTSSKPSSTHSTTLHGAKRPQQEEILGHQQENDKKESDHGATVVVNSSKPSSGSADAIAPHMAAAVENMMDMLDDGEDSMIIEDSPSVGQPSDLQQQQQQQQQQTQVQPTEQDVGLPLTHEGAYKWLYRDPQGELQGPFEESEMLEWFEAGYFAMTLLLKRGCDEVFLPLGELLKRWNTVPFKSSTLPRPPPPLKRSHLASSSTVASSVASATVAPTMSSQDAVAGLPSDDPRLRMALIEQQRQVAAQAIQQQAILRQYQLTSLIQNLQRDENFAKLAPAQQQAIALKYLQEQQAQAQQLLLAQQQQQQQLAAAAAAVSSSASVSTGSLFPLLSQQGGEKMTAVSQNAWQAQLQAQQQAQAQGIAQTSTVGGPWAGGAPSSVWDIDASKVHTAESLEEIQRRELERQEHEKVDREERTRREEEIRRQQLEEDRIRQEERDRQEREEIERQAALDRQRREELERKRQADIERQRIEQSRREAEETRRREAEQARIAEEQKRRREEEEAARRAEEFRMQEEQRKLREAEELEKRRQEEIKRRQEKADEQRRQQQAEAAWRAQQEAQLQNMKLPQSANWANNPNQQQQQAPTLAQIQEAEAKQQEEMNERKRKMKAAKAAEMAVLEQQKQKARGTWSGQHVQQVNAAAMGGSTKSLLEIQQEQERQERQNTAHQQRTTAASIAAQYVAPPSSSSSTGVWGNPTWGTEGAWAAKPTPPTTSFWDAAAESSTNELPNNISNNKKKLAKKVATEQAKAQAANHAAFPALGNDHSSRGTNNKKSTGGAAAGSKQSKKEEESVQKHFSNNQPQDAFTRWCEGALHRLHGSVDVPVFAGFLNSLEPGDEVRQYVKDYFGEGIEQSKFVDTFLEKRRTYKYQQSKEDDFMAGPAKAVTPKNNNNVDDMSKMASAAAVSAPAPKAKKGKKNKMQRLEPSLLGFSCSADSTRVNIGEIESIPDSTK